LSVLLDEWDKELERRGHRFVRYADDSNIYVRSRRAGERVLAWCRRFLERRLRLIVNESKSAVARPWALGERLSRLQRDAASVPQAPAGDLHGAAAEGSPARDPAPHPGALAGAHRVRAEPVPTGLARVLSLDRDAERADEAPELDPPQAALLPHQAAWPGEPAVLGAEKLGIPSRDLGWLVTTSRGPWRLSRNPEVHRGFSARFFAALGLFQIPPAWRTLASTR
jgi:hypothetical protein